MQQSEAACQQTDVLTMMQQEAQVPDPSAATDLSQRTGAIGNSGTISGSHNPIIVNSSGVNINYNFPLEGPGVPAPRPQHSQRPDQEPRLMDPCQEAGNKTRDNLKILYKTTGSYVQLSPKVDDDQRHIAGIYTKVQLETREGVADVTGKKGETVNSTEYAKIFRLRTRTGELIKRLIFFGMGGVGKSTIFDKIAYDWADEANEILNGFKLVFLLEMCALSQKSNLVDSAFDQLLDEDSGIAKDKLDQFILANPNEVLILLDGFDEMKTKTLDADSFGSILKALNRTKYRECFICVSTRPSHLETLMSKTLVENPCTHVKVLGFADEDVNEYVQKFYDEDPDDSGSALIQTIRKSNILSEFSTNPMLLLLMCLLWRESKQLPETTSRLFTEAVEHMFTSKTHIKDASETVIAIGKTALNGLMNANKRFSFQENEFEPIALDLALKAGILTKARVIKNRKSHNNIQFMHKTMQEYCAAKYLQSLTIPTLRFLTRWKKKITFQNKLRQMCSKLKDVVSNDFLFRFCCGDNERCMTHIVNLLDSKFNKDEPRYQSEVVQVISRNCFFESQSKNPPQCLTRDSQIPSTIKVDNNNDFRSLIYLLEIISSSESRTAQLARVETIEVSRVSSVSDLAVALGYMENLRNLRLYSCPLVTGDLEKTLMSLKCHKLLTNLCIKWDSTLGGRAIEWAPHIKHLTSLNKLEISYCKLKITDIEHIALSVSDMPTLTNLSLAGNTELGRSAGRWAKNVSQFTYIQTLNLSNCTLQWTDIEHIASAVSDMPSLTVLILTDNTELGRSAGRWAKNVSQFTYIQTLNLSNCTLEWTDIEHIAWAAGDMPRLTDLILTDNPALGASTEEWSRYLFRVKQKHTLDLSNSSLTWKDIDTISIVLDHIPALTILNLTSNTALGGSAEMWAKNSLQYTNIQTLNLSNCTLQWTDIEHIASVISGIPTLTNLSLAGNTSLSESSDYWTKNLLRFTNIQTLSLSHCTLQWRDIENIALAVSDMPRLTNLILTDNPALGASTEKWSRYLFRVKEKHTLDLSNSSLTWKDVDTISVVVNHIPALTKLSLAGNTALGGLAEKWVKKLPEMTQLDLSSCNLTPTDIKHIASAVYYKPSLTDIILGGNRALGGSIKLCANALPKMLQINRLDLSFCDLTPTDIEHIASAVGNMPSLTDMILAGNQALGRSAEKWAKELPKMWQLYRLSLSFCDLTPTDIEHIASAVGNMPELTDMILAGNQALGRSAEKWAKELPKMLRLNRLDLSFCDLTPTDIEHISSAVGNMPELTALNLAGNQALGRSAKKWAKELPKMLRLNRLDLSFCDLTTTDIKHIASAVGNMPELAGMILGGNKALSKSAELCAKELLKMRHLKMLDLSNCNFKPSDCRPLAVFMPDMPFLTLHIGDNQELFDKLKSYLPPSNSYFVY
ncbi:NLR family CARD domain-containing protein 4-like [Patiria miniata]|uniref:NACHT domain-containing protein n=1 Tax=Patiria miniata TaxID=46514 RepID=A0A913Z4G0_PATMI|nr:NLR family CARD domain-containing protein 4-like [Patiria miniata]